MLMTSMSVDDDLKPPHKMKLPEESKSPSLIDEIKDLKKEAISNCVDEKKPDLLVDTISNHESKHGSEYIKSETKAVEDKGIQTEDYTWLQNIVEKVVKVRMNSYAGAAGSDDKMDEKLAPILKRLKAENSELREKANILKMRLERMERAQAENKKRPSVTTEEATPAKRITPTSTVSTTPPSLATGKSPSSMERQKTESIACAPIQPVSMTSPIQPVSMTSPVHPAVSIVSPVRHMSIPSPVRQMSPIRPVSMQSSIRPMYLPSMQHPQQFYQFIPNSAGGPPQRVLLQSAYQANGGDGFVLVENPNQSPYNMNTQVVVANQGVRMASLPNVNAKDNRGQGPQRPPNFNTLTKAYTGGRGNRFPSYNPPPNSKTPNNANIWANQLPVMVAPHQNTTQNRQPLAQTSVPAPQRQFGTNVSVNKQANSNIANSSSTPRVPLNEARIALPFNPLPKLKASISASGDGIILTWDYETPGEDPDKYQVECYLLFAHQAKCNVRPRAPSDIKPWKKIGLVNALPLPMACTLTQFATGNVYYFAVVAVDIHGREGEMSNPCIIRLNLNG